MKCKFCKSKHSMYDLAHLSYVYSNFMCFDCGAHYEGHHEWNKPQKLKWYTKKEWEDAIEKAWKTS